jgi:uncharacterized lipoprotein YddW (UPF0748 family)
MERVKSRATLRELKRIVKPMNQNVISRRLRRADWAVFLMAPVFRGGRRALLALLPLLIVLSACSAQPATPDFAGRDLNSVPPRPLREFRGVWVASYANINWPSRPGLSSQGQQEELLAILDKAAQLRLNAVILQVRPACDAFYASTLEPWSSFLSGETGKAPEPFYDPLEFAIVEAHKRGLELHAWFNPYRAGLRHSVPASSPHHIARTKPRLVRTHGKYLWLDPGEKEVQQHVLEVILDVVRRYDLDGIHLDDYFYPYPERGGANSAADFQDEQTYNRYRSLGGTLSRADWRRQNINEFIETLYRQVKAEKKWVKVGISPFGIWRPGYPAQVRGLDYFQTNYADSRLWLASGWLDYFTPQLYWSIQSREQSYPALLQWWARENVQQRHLWPGNNVARVGGEWAPEEIANQILLTRRQPGASGNILFSMSFLMQNAGGISDLLSQRIYTEPALPPPSPWLADRRPAKPNVLFSASEDGYQMRWENPGEAPVRLWFLQKRIRGNWASEIVPGKVTSQALRFDDFPELVALTPVDRNNISGPATLVDLRPLLARGKR